MFSELVAGACQQADEGGGGEGGSSEGGGGGRWVQYASACTCCLAGQPPSTLLP